MLRLQNCPTGNHTNEGSLNTAVALILFNRPDLTERVMREIAKARPKKLFLIADGPRKGNAADAEKCAQAREAADRMIDWDCEVHRRYLETNLNCGHGPASGISWVFEHVDRAIILEDDCIPHPTFFRFCDEMLEKYADDERIAQVSGNFHHYGRKGGSGSYFFSRHIHCAGGWATWRRVWQHYDFEIGAWPQLRDTPWLEYVIGHEGAAKMWHQVFDAAYAAKGKVDYWDYQWAFTCWSQSGMAIVPNVGLISNVGFRPDGTHTFTESRWANLSMEAMRFPLKHPTCVIPDRASDYNFIETFLVPKSPSFFKRVRSKLPRHMVKLMMILLGG